jgi:hypothetical protein
MGHGHYNQGQQNYVDPDERFQADLSFMCMCRLCLKDEVVVVQILILASARIVCNIVYVQVRDRIHRELCCEN